MFTRVGHGEDGFFTQRFVLGDLTDELLEENYQAGIKAAEEREEQQK